MMSNHDQIFRLDHEEVDLSTFSEAALAPLRREQDPEIQQKVISIVENAGKEKVMKDGNFCGMSKKEYRRVMALMESSEGDEVAIATKSHGAVRKQQKKTAETNKHKTEKARQTKQQRKNAEAHKQRQNIKWSYQRRINRENPNYHVERGLKYISTTRPKVFKYITPIGINMEEKQARNRARIEGGSHANLEKHEVYIRDVREDGKVQIPKGIRKAYDLQKGDAVIWVDRENDIVVRFMSRTLKPKERA